MSISNKENDNLKYAWKWFEYHANQRLINFRFFLISFGAIGYILIQVIKLGKICELFIPIVLLSGGMVIYFITSLFCLIEIRNRELVDCSRKVIDDMNLIEARFFDKKRTCLKYVVKEYNLPIWVKDYEKQISHTYVYGKIFTYTRRMGILIAGGGFLFLLIKLGFFCWLLKKIC